MTLNRRTLAGTALAAALTAVLATAMTTAITPAAAQAQPWPTKPVKIVVPYAPGGAVDVVTRKMAQKLTEQTGQSFFVENRPGGTGTIGATQVARADADGYTLMANDTTFSLIPHIFKKLPFDPNDLTPVAAYVFAPMGLVVSSTSRYKTLGDMLADAKTHPAKVSYGSGGAGTTPHFATEALGMAAGVKFMHVPFKGAAEATQAILSSTIDTQIASTTGLMGNVKGGKLNMLAVSGEARLPALPNVPTFREAGVNWPGVVNWTGLWAPRGTPPAVIDRLQTEVAKAMTSADMKNFATDMGADPRAVESAVFARILKESTANWGKVAASTTFERQ